MGYDKFEKIKQNLIQLARDREDIYAVIEFGSQARTKQKADDYSDLDIMIITSKPDYYIGQDEWLEHIGETRISFVEPTFAGGRERRILFSGNLDVDYVMLTKEQCSSIFEDHFIDVIVSRGYCILYDSIELSERFDAIKSYGEQEKTKMSRMTEAEFTNRINDFWFHIVWASKKLRRGELWSAKMCIDAYLKNHLLSMMEFYHISIHGAEYDVWHDGRFLDQWADEDVRAELMDCFGHYSLESMEQALERTAVLFARLAKESAHRNAYQYPITVQQYALECVGRDCMVINE